MKKIKVLVLMGGISSEREVSLSSGKSVADALRQADFDVAELDLNAENIGEIASFAPDVAFIALHGKGGEDGAVQGALDWLGIPYTGSGVAASALCMDKILTKKTLSHSGIPTPDFLDLGEVKESEVKEKAEKAVRELGIPVVFKAARQGSSIGIAIVRNKDDAEDALKQLLPLGDPILAEAFVAGKELSVPVLGNEDPIVLPVIEILSDGAFYDYESKYTPGKSRHVIPAEITAEQYKKTEELAKKTYLATGCRGYARVDFLLDDKGEPQVLEVNTAPGMTVTSLFPDAAKHAGISFPELVTKLVHLALEK